MSRSIGEALALDPGKSGRPAPDRPRQASPSSEISRGWPPPYLGTLAGGTAQRHDCRVRCVKRALRGILVPISRSAWRCAPSRIIFASAAAWPRTCQVP